MLRDPSSSLQQSSREVNPDMQALIVKYRAGRQQRVRAYDWLVLPRPHPPTAHGNRGHPASHGEPLRQRGRPVPAERDHRHPDRRRHVSRVRAATPDLT